MKISLLSCLFLLTLLSVVPKSYSQDSIRTEVFNLSTCDPAHFSLIKELGNERTRKRFVSKLEARSNKPTMFHITGINPLRYKYYINNEAVTRFMESSPLTFSINSFINGEYLLTAPEIRIPEIFKTDSISSKVKIKIREFQNTIKDLVDSIKEAYSRQEELWSRLNEDKDSAAAAKAYLASSQNRQINNKIDKFRSQYDRALREYEMYTAGLPINNPTFEILKYYSGIITFLFMQDEINEIKRYQKKFADQYLVHHNKFKYIDSLLSVIGGSNYEYNRYNQTDKQSAMRALIDSLRYYSFTWSQPSFYISITGKSYIQDNINDVKQQMLNKRFQLYEEFVLNVATRIGVLMQNQFREYSSYNNALESFSCITPDLLKEIEEKRTKLIKTFDFIQKTSAELQIMVSYLDINTDLYQNIAKKINTNYVYLLSYLKNLNYVMKENTKQYTLPTHTNLNNVDLIRYKVTREDKITNSTQIYNYDFWLRGGLKIDFSVGFFGTRLIDNKYSKVLLDTTGGIDSFRITRQDDGHTDFAFGGMVNITPRTGASWIYVGGSVGVAYSSNQKLQVLAGLSLHLGKTERLIVHGGVAFGTIKYLDIAANDFKFFDRELRPVTREKLDDVKEKDRVYILRSEDISFSSYVIPAVEKFVARPFIGISYNLSKKNALQAVSGAGVQKFTDNYNNPVTY